MTSTRQLVGVAMLAAALIGASCSSDSKSSSTTSAEAAEPNTSAPEPDATGGSQTTGTAESTVAPETTSSAAADGFSVAAGLRQIPSAVRDSDEGSGSDIQITMSDLDAATELADSERPPDGTTDVDALTEWLLSINGPGRKEKASLVGALLPQAAQPERFAQAAEFADELGWSISDVHTFVEYDVPPNVFTVMSGTFAADSLTKAIGEPTDEIWKLGGDDFSVDVSGVSAARPLGEALRLALRDDSLAVARSTPPIEAWLANDGDAAAGTLAEDEGLAAVAAALDESDVYSAVLSQADFAAVPPNESPEVAAATPGLGPFSTLGVGQTVVDGTPYAVFVYYFDEETDAAAAVDRLTALLDDGASNRTHEPWKESFAIDDITATGHVLKATLRLTDFPPGAVWNIVYARDNLVSGSK